MLPYFIGLRLSGFKINILYINNSDTDSVLLGLTGLTLESLVLEHKRADWHNKILPKWFADATPTGQKTPGFFKEEFASTKGKFIGLRLLNKANNLLITEMINFDMKIICSA